MNHRSKCLVVWAASAATLGIVAIGSPVYGALDGSLTAGEGYGATPLVTQVNVTTSPSADNGGTGGVADEVTATNTSRLNQLSNAFAFVDTTTTPASPVLHLFIGGSVAGISGQDTKIELAMQTNAAGGPSSLSGQNLNGGLPNVQFQGFNPNVLFQFTPFSNNGGGTAGDGGTLFKNLTTPSSSTVAVNSNHTGTDNSTVGIATNNALVTTAIGAGGTGDPGFAGAAQGIEFTIPLSSLPSADTSYGGGAIKAFLFLSVGNDGRTDNQLLAPFNYGTDNNSFDYTYLGNTNGAGAAGGDPNQNGRQFISQVYPVDTSASNPGGSQFFTIPSPVPEPASMSVLALGGVALVRRRRAR